MIGHPTTGLSRNTDFYNYINGLEVPCDQLRMSPLGLSPAKARNVIFEQALVHNCTHVFLVDDDMALGRYDLARLLARDKDVISGIYPTGTFPHQPIAFTEFADSGRAKVLNLTPNVSGVIKVVATGFGCCLIKTDVLKKMTRPWVRLGELDSEQWCDDIGFFWRLHKEVPDAEVYLDTDVRPGHMKTLMLSIHKDAEGWKTGYNASGAVTLYLPQVDTSILHEKGILAAHEIEGWMMDSELEWLAKTAADKKIIVEFGSHCGKSTRAIADNSPNDARIYAVDPWSGEYKDTENNQWDVLGGSRFLDFQRNLFHHINAGRVIPVKKFSTDFQLENEKADFVFIDGDHRYEAVIDDIINSMRWLSPNGIISGHDYGHESWPGVKQAVDEFFPGVVNVHGTIWWVDLSKLGDSNGVN